MRLWRRSFKEESVKKKKNQTPLHFSEVLSTVPSIFLLFHIILRFFFLGLLCNNLYSFACSRCNHFVFGWFYSLFFCLDGLGVLLRITHYR